MSNANLLRRTTFVVESASETAAFYKSVFGFTEFYNNRLPVDARFPPTGLPDGAKAHLIILKVEDPLIGMLGLLEYLEPRLPPKPARTDFQVRIGEPLLVIDAPDVDAVYERAKSASAMIASPPADWEVPHYDGVQKIKLRTMALFDPNGVYIEVNRRRT
jgi:catechol 2,3-dioxygenase-like lactoylglutathione lyase family enzyme